jgi:hypothetical protein
MLIDGGRIVEVLLINSFDSYILFAVVRQPKPRPGGRDTMI